MVAITESKPSQPSSDPAEKSPDQTADTTIAETKEVTLSILSDVTAAQSAHGLKHSDYERYRKYCTRRLARIRSATATSSKHPSQTRRYAPQEITREDVQRDARFLTIPLVLAERDWAFAMHVKRTKAGGEARARRRVNAKLLRAIAHANTLSTLCRDAGDEHTVLEAEAYAKGMQAALALEHEAMPSALQAFEVVQKIYTGMAGLRSGTSDAALYERKLEEVSQAVRFCKYNMARSDGADGDDLLERLRGDAADVSSDAIGEKIEAALVEARRRAAVKFGHVTWCGIDVELRSERVREAVLTVEEENKAFEARPQAIDAYDKLFVVFNDALEVISNEYADFNKSADRSGERVVELELLQAYLTFKRLQHTIARNLLLVESLKARRQTRPDDFVRMYDNLMANMSDTMRLRGVPEDAAVYNDAKSRLQLFTAYRCFYLSQCYQNAELEREAAALFDRVGEIASLLSGERKEEAQKLVLQCTGMKYRARAVAFLKDVDGADGMSALSIGGHANGIGGGDAAGIVRKSMMVDHLDEVMCFVDSDDGVKGEMCGVSICDMPPALEAVPCKPVLFDLAIDGVRLPDGEEEQKDEEVADSSNEKASGAEEAPQPTSTSSFAGLSSTRLGRWWSGSSS